MIIFGIIKDLNINIIYKVIFLFDKFDIIVYLLLSLCDVYKCKNLLDVVILIIFLDEDDDGKIYLIF